MNYKNPCLLGMIYHNRSFTYELLESMPTNIKNPSTVAYRNFVTDLLEYVHPHVVYDKSVFIFFKKKGVARISSQKAWFTTTSSS